MPCLGLLNPNHDFGKKFEFNLCLITDRSLKFFFKNRDNIPLEWL